MKIQIDEIEISEAIECYLEKQGINISEYNLEIDVNAGRGEYGPRIEISMEKREVEPEESKDIDSPKDPFNPAAPEPKQED